MKVKVNVRVRVNPLESARRIASLVRLRIRIRIRSSGDRRLISSGIIQMLMGLLIGRLGRAAAAQLVPMPHWWGFAYPGPWRKHC